MKFRCYKSYKKEYKMILYVKLSITDKFFNLHKKKKRSKFDRHPFYFCCFTFSIVFNEARRNCIIEFFPRYLLENKLLLHYSRLETPSIIHG